MNTVTIKGNLRESLGKKDAKNLRVQGNVPCVLYGKEEPLHFYAVFNEFRKLVYTPNVYLIDILIDGKKYPAIVQDIQWHPIDEQILHVDFLSISEDKPVKIEIPVKTIGMAKGIKQGGKLRLNMRRLKVKALAKDLPDTIDINVEDLEVGESIKVGEIKVDNLELLDNKSNMILSVNVTRISKSMLPEAETESETEETTEEASETSETTESTDTTESAEN